MVILVLLQVLKECFTVGSNACLSLPLAPQIYILKRCNLLPKNKKVDIFKS